MSSGTSTPPIRPVDVRRALLGLLVTAGRPLDIAELTTLLVTELGEGHGGADGRKRVADAMRYQQRLGRVRRVARGTYEYVPASMSRSTEWRCVHWRSERDRAFRRLGPATAR